MPRFNSTVRSNLVVTSTSCSAILLPVNSIPLPPYDAAGSELLRTSSYSCSFPSISPVSSSTVVSGHSNSFCHRAEPRRAGGSDRTPTSLKFVPLANLDWPRRSHQPVKVLESSAEPPVFGGLPTTMAGSSDENGSPGNGDSNHQIGSPNGDDSIAMHDAVPDNSSVPKPKRLACMICRKRKLKCDGVRPSCSTCSRLGHSCAYDEQRRKSGPKRGYVKALEERLSKCPRFL